jgi:hypothetical protein
MNSLPPRAQAINRNSWSQSSGARTQATVLVVKMRLELQSHVRFGTQGGFRIPVVTGAGP